MKSKMTAIEPLFLHQYIFDTKTNIECFSFESILHVIVPKSVGKHCVGIVIDKTNELAQWNHMRIELQDHQVQMGWFWRRLN